MTSGQAPPEANRTVPAPKPFLLIGSRRGRDPGRRQVTAPHTTLIERDELTSNAPRARTLSFPKIIWQTRSRMIFFMCVCVCVYVGVGVFHPLSRPVSQPVSQISRQSSNGDTLSEPRTAFSRPQLDNGRNATGYDIHRDRCRRSRSKSISLHLV